MGVRVGVLAAAVVGGSMRRGGVCGTATSPSACPAPSELSAASFVHSTRTCTSSVLVRVDDKRAALSRGESTELRLSILDCDWLLLTASDWSVFELPDWLI